MEGSAKVDSIDALKDCRASLFKFAAEARAALEEADTELRRAAKWLQSDRRTVLQGRIHKLGDAVTQARNALRQKKMFKSASGHAPACIEEEQALRTAQRRLEEAEQKLANCKRWTQALDKETLQYRGLAQTMAGVIESDVPRAAAHLDRMMQSLEGYLAAAGATLDDLRTSSAAGASMARGSAPTDQAADRLDMALRRRGPGLTARAGITVDTLTDNDAPIGTPIDPSDLTTLRRLMAQRQPVDPDDKIVTCRGSLTQRRLYLGRNAAPAGGDSGWTIGPADLSAPVGEFMAVRAADLLARRPDLGDLLELPHGSLVVIEGQAIDALFDEHGQDVWPNSTNSTKGRA